MQTVKKRGKSNQKFIAKDALPKLTEAVLSADSLPSNLILHLKKIPMPLKYLFVYSLA